MNISLILLSIFIAPRAIFASIEVYCDYQNWGTEGYACILKNEVLTTSKDDRTVVKVQGRHSNGKRDEDVTIFYSYGKNVSFIPRDITKFLPNIERFEIRSGGIEEISKNDLKQFGEKLKFLSIEKSDLIVIESDLFEYNKNLEFLYLRYCGIKHIEDGAFDGLKKLENLAVSANPCTSNDDEVKNDREKVLKLIKVVERKCKDPESNLRKRKVPEALKLFSDDSNYNEATLDSNSLVESLNAKIAEIEKLYEENSQLRNENLKLKALNLQSESFEKLNEKFKALELKVDENFQKLAEDSKKNFNELKALQKTSEEFNRSSLEKFSRMIVERVEDVCKEEDIGTSE